MKDRELLTRIGIRRRFRSDIHPLAGIKFICEALAMFNNLHRKVLIVLPDLTVYHKSGKDNIIRSYPTLSLLNKDVLAFVFCRDKNG